MPRINRVRDNVLYDKETVKHNPATGGHDTVDLTKRRQKTFAIDGSTDFNAPEALLGYPGSRESFTARLVEWLLDTDPPQYTTGFCFAESLGSGNRELTILCISLNTASAIPGTWTISPCGRRRAHATTNSCAGCSEQPPGRCAIGADRRQDYRRELKTFIDPEEWSTSSPPTRPKAG